MSGSEAENEPVVGLESPSHNGMADDAEITAAVDEIVQEQEKAEEKTKVPRIIPKLDATRLTGPRGIGILPDVFKDVTILPKGNEIKNLNTVMNVLELWAHRLMPNMRFDDVIARCEVLGTKRPVQTYVHKMRLDMPLLDDDFVREEPEPEMVVPEELNAMSDFIEPVNSPLSSHSHKPFENVDEELTAEQEELLNDNIFDTED